MKARCYCLSVGISSIHLSSCNLSVQPLQFRSLHYSLVYACVMKDAASCRPNMQAPRLNPEDILRTTGIGKTCVAEGRLRLAKYWIISKAHDLGNDCGGLAKTTRLKHRISTAFSSQNIARWSPRNKATREITRTKDRLLIVDSV